MALPPEQALLLFQKAVEAYPDSIEARLARGQVLLSLGRLDEALADLDLVVERSPSATPRLARAQCLRFLERYPEALAEFDRLFELERSPAGLLARAETHVAMGSFGRARDDAREALELDPELGQAWCILGLALFVDKQHARAIPNFNQALACDPQLAQAHYLRAQCFRSEGDLGSALEDFEAFLEFEPDNPAAIFARAEVLKALGRDEESRAQMQRARRLCDDTKLAEVIEERLRAR